MEKITKLTLKGKYNDRLTQNFRELVSEQIGKLDTATSFMYLYRRFGEPTFTNKDEYKILYDYRFKHEDILVTVHASYYECVYFSLFVPQKRIASWQKNRNKFFRRLYKKYNDIPFMPFAYLPYKKALELTEAEHQKNWDLIYAAMKTNFSKKDFDYIRKQFISVKPDVEVFKMLMPLESKLCTEFRAKLTAAEIEELNNFLPKIKDIAGLEKQCMCVINELKRGFYVRDVAINICGYEGESNVITEHEQTA